MHEEVTTGWSQAAPMGLEALAQLGLSPPAAETMKPPSPSANPMQ